MVHGLALAHIRWVLWQWH